MTRPPAPASDAGLADVPEAAAASGEPLVGAAPGEGTGGSGPVSSVAGPGHPDGVVGGTETDPLSPRRGCLPLAAHRLVFRPFPGERLPPRAGDHHEAPRRRDGADRRGARVAGYTPSSSGNAVFDAAAKAALESTRGQELPPPPENYPDLVQAQISLTFVCKEGRCD